MNGKPLTNDEIDFVIQRFEGKSCIEENERCVLVIDDDKWVHEIIQSYLTGMGFRLLKAYDPVDGLALAVKHRPVLIILDIILPKMKGDVILNLLKKINATSNIPVITISGYFNMDVLLNAFKGGAMGFLTKPFTRESLLQRIEECLSPPVFSSYDCNEILQKGKIRYKKKN